jgi:hypothetical protein
VPRATGGGFGSQRTRLRFLSARAFSSFSSFFFLNLFVYFFLLAQEPGLQRVLYRSWKRFARVLLLLFLFFSSSLFPRFVFTRQLFRAARTRLSRLIPGGAFREEIRTTHGPSRLVRHRLGVSRRSISSNIAAAFRSRFQRGFIASLAAASPETFHYISLRLHVAGMFLSRRMRNRPIVIGDASEDTIYGFCVW